MFVNFDDYNKPNDTLLIYNKDTIKAIRNLFENAREVNAKFPLKYEIAFLGKGIPDIYHGNGEYFRRDRKTFALQEGSDFALFEPIVNSKSKDRVR